MEESPKTAWRALLALAALFVVVYGLQEAANILLPIVLAVFISVASMPVLRLLQRFGVPGPLAVLGIVLVIAGALAGLSGIIAGAVASFTSNIDQYERPLNDLVANSLQTAEAYGVPIERTQLTQLLSPDTVVSVLGQTVGAVVAPAAATAWVCDASSDCCCCCDMCANASCCCWDMRWKASCCCWDISAIMRCASAA